jgi:WD40 repeat protein
MKDFFISYNKADRQMAEWIAWVLEEEGYTTILQAWDFRPGSNFILEMQRATSNTKRTLAVLSPDYLQALFTQPEWAAAFAKDPTGAKRTLVGVRVRRCELEGLLPQIVYIDLVGLEEADAQERLLSGVKEGRAKPATRPEFVRSKEHSVVNHPEFPEPAPPQRRPLLSFRQVADIVEEKSQQVYGRESELAELLRYVDNAPSGHRMIIAPAGTGKTALMARAAREFSRRHACVAYHFFSQVAATTSVEECYENLLFQIARQRHHLLLEEEGTAREIIARLLVDWDIERNGQLILLLDALDEAGSRMDAQEYRYFRYLARGVFVFTSCRLDDDDPRSEVRIWHDEGNPVRLGPMSDKGVGEWMRSGFGGILRPYTRLARKLCDASDGLPLYLEYLLKDAADIASESGEIERFFQTIPRGLEAYVKEQVDRFDPQQGFTREMLRILSLLTLAKGPMPVTTVLGVLRLDLEPVEISNASRFVQRWWNRLLVVDPRGMRQEALSFTHPRLSSAFAASPTIQARRQVPALLDWMASHWDQGCTYSLRFYVEHLTEHLRHHLPQTIGGAIRAGELTAVSQRLLDILGDLYYIHLKSEASQLPELLTDYQGAMLPLAEVAKSILLSSFASWNQAGQPADAKPVPVCFTACIQSYYRFLLRNQHRLRSWPDRTLDLALQEPASSPVARSAEQKQSPRLSRISRFLWVSPESSDDSVLTYTGHRVLIDHIIPCPPARQFVSADVQGNVHVYSTDTGALLQVLPERGTKISALMMLPDQRTMVSQESDGTVRSFDTRIGYERAAIHNLAGAALETNDGGDRIFVGTDTGEVVVLDSSSFAVMERFKIGQLGIKALRFIPELGRLLAADRGGTIAAIHLASRKLSRRRVKGEPIRSIWWNHTQREAVTIGYDLQVIRWKLPRLLPTVVSAPQDAFPIDFGIFPDGCRGVILDEEGNITVLDLVTGRTLATSRVWGNEDPVALAVLNDSYFLIAGDHTLGAYSAQNGQLTYQFRGTVSGLDRLTLSAEDERIYVADENLQIKEWRVPAKLQKVSTEAQPDLSLINASAVESLAFSSDGDQLLVGRALDHAALLAWEDGHIMTTYPGKGRDSAAMAFSPDGQTVYGITRPWGVQAWDRQGEQVVSIALEMPMDDTAACLVCSPNGGVVYVMPPKGAVLLWRPDIRQRNPGVVRGCGAPGDMNYMMALSPDGRWLAISRNANEGGERFGDFVEIVDAATLESRALVRLGGRITSLAFRWDGALFAGDPEGVIYRWEIMKSGQTMENKRVEGHRSTVMAIAVLDDGSGLVSVGADLTLHLWDCSTLAHRDLFLLPSQPRTVACGRGGRVAVGCRDGLLMRLQCNA